MMGYSFFLRCLLLPVSCATMIFCIASGDSCGNHSIGGKTVKGVTVRASLPSAGLVAGEEDEGTGIKQRWQASDSILVSRGSGLTRRDGLSDGRDSTIGRSPLVFATTDNGWTAPAGASAADFTNDEAEYSEGDHLFAWYPGSLPIIDSTATIDLRNQGATLSDSQNTAVFFASAVFHEAGTSLDFVNISSTLRLKLTFPEDVTIRSIELISPDLAGRAEAIASMDTVTFSEELKSDIKAVPSVPVVTTDKKATVFVSVIPQTIDPGLLVKATATDGTVYLSTRTDAMTCAAGDVQTVNMPEMARSEITLSSSLSQQTFSDIPAGNYSGITRISGNRYAVANDKSPADGFCIFDIDIDSATGAITSASSEGFFGNSNPNRDEEGIAYVPSAGTLFMSGEAGNEVLEYNLDGSLTGRKLSIPPVFSGASGNCGLESLGYSGSSHLFWTTSESTIPADGVRASSANGVKNRLRLQSFDENMQPREQYAYEMDAPASMSSAARYAMGVSDITALDDGRLIVLEREFYVTSIGFGSFVDNKLYIVNPANETAVTSDTVFGDTAPYMRKTLLTSFSTSFMTGIANYEGMCLGPVLDDGTKTLILVSDSQNQYKGVLKDWFKVILFN